RRGHRVYVPVIAYRKSSGYGRVMFISFASSSTLFRYSENSPTDNLTVLLGRHMISRRTTAFPALPSRSTLTTYSSKPRNFCLKTSCKSSEEYPSASDMVLSHIQYVRFCDVLRFLR